MRLGAKLLCVGTLALASCYGPVRDQSRIVSTVALPDGRVAVAYHQYLYRPAAGFAAYPDGGIPLTLRDRFVVGVVSPDGTIRTLAEFPNKALPGAGTLSLRWFREDPGHLFGSRGGQQTTTLPLRDFNQQMRFALTGGRVQHFDLRAEMARNGRTLGAEGFGDFEAIGADGTMLVGATFGSKRELWLRAPSGPIRRLASFDRFDRRTTNYLFYSDTGPPFTTYALELSTGDARPVLRYNLQNTQQEWQARGDPAFRELNGTEAAPAADTVIVGDDGRSVRYLRDGRLLWQNAVKM